MCEMDEKLDIGLIVLCFFILVGIVIYFVYMFLESNKNKEPKTGWNGFWIFHPIIVWMWCDILKIN